jgi:riboflavin biosynthesis pyrimidine reductase
MNVIEHVISGIETRRSVEITLEELENYYPAVAGFRFNFVTQGQVQLQTTSDLITSTADRAILRQIRSISDLIITSGKTAVRENLTGSRFAPILVLTNHDALKARLCTETSIKSVFVTTDRKDCANANCYPVGKTSAPLSEWVQEFCKEYRSIVIETGLTLARELSSLINEIDITVTNALTLVEATGSAEIVLSRIGLKPKLKQIIQIDSDFFFRYKVS